MKASIVRIAPIALATCLAACVAGSDSPPEPEVGEAELEQQAPPPPVLTFSMKVHSKLFINGVPNCGAHPSLFAGLAGWAAWRAFCGLTARRYTENPPTGALVIPLDARILGIATASWRCQAGNAAPIGPTLVAGGGS